MANLLKYSGGVLTQGNLPETWTAPTSLFGTQDRADTGAGTFASATSRWTAPASDLPDGFLLIGAFEYQDTSNGRFNPQARFAQISGTGNFVTGTTGGYSRDNSEDRSYVRTWAFWDSPSASGTIDFQWKADTDDATGGTERSELQVIPFYYSDIGLYTSTDATGAGSTTPTIVPGFTGTDGTNITITSNVISCTGDNKKYLVLASQFFEGFDGARTQRWHSLGIDGTEEPAAKAYSFYRNAANDENGDLFTWMFETSTATITVEMLEGLGAGVANLQGGADVTGGATQTTGAHAMVVIELNDSAEGFVSTDVNQSALLATTGPIDLDINETPRFMDTASFTDVVVSSVNCVQTGDILLGANISAASNAVADTTRWTAYSEFTVNGTEDADSVSGDYMRNNQTTQDTFGWSANLLGFQAVTAGDDVGVSVTELTGSEGGGAGVSPAGWSGFWGLNLDTLSVSDTTVETTTDALVLAENTADIVLDVTVTGIVDALILAEGTAEVSADPVTDVWATGYWGNNFWADNYWRITLGADTTVETTTDALVLTENVADIVLDVTVESATDALVLTENQSSIALDVVVTGVTDALVLTENQATVVLDVAVETTTDALVLTENTADIVLDVTVGTVTDALVLTENQATITADSVIETTTDALVLTENTASVVVDVAVDTATDALVLAENQATVSLDVDIATVTDALVLTENQSSIIFDVAVNTVTDALVLTENTADISSDSGITTITDALILTEGQAGIVLDVTVTGVTDALVLTENTATIDLDVTIESVTDALTLTENQASITADNNVNTTTDALTLTEGTASIIFDVTVSTTTDGLILTEGQAGVALDVTIQSIVDALTLTEGQATIDTSGDTTVNAITDALILTEGSAVIHLSELIEAGRLFSPTYRSTYR